MEITSPEEFREQPVIDIEVEFIGGIQNAWTINDEADTYVGQSLEHITFDFLSTRITVERRNVLWWGFRKRIDRIPVQKQKGTPAPSSQQPEGGSAGN